MDLLEFELDRKIDPEQLDVECVRQADLYFKYAERAIMARGEADRLKLKLDVLRAELELKVRKSPRRYELDRVTDASVRAVVDAMPKFVEANVEWFRARDDAMILDKAVMAMDVKQRMLQKLIDLHGQSYFAGPSAPRDLKQAWMLQQNRASERVQKRQVGIARKRGEDD